MRSDTRNACSRVRRRPGARRPGGPLDSRGLRRALSPPAAATWSVPAASMLRHCPTDLRCSLRLRSPAVGLGHSSLDGNPELCVAVVHGRDDEVVSPSRSIRTSKILEEAGYDVSLDMIPGGHNDLMVEDSDPARFEDGSTSHAEGADLVIAVILDLVSETSERC